MKRGITELITPGVNISKARLLQASNQFPLAAIHINRTSIGAAFLDVSTGEFLCAQGEKEDIDKLPDQHSPRARLPCDAWHQAKFCEENFTQRCPVYEMDDWVYTSDAAEERLMKHFGKSSLMGFRRGPHARGGDRRGQYPAYLDPTPAYEISHITSRPHRARPFRGTRPFHGAQP